MKEKIRQTFFTLSGRVYKYSILVMFLPSPKDGRVKHVFYCRFRTWSSVLDELPKYFEYLSYVLTNVRTVCELC